MRTRRRVRSSTGMDYGLMLEVWTGRDRITAEAVVWEDRHHDKTLPANSPTW